MAHIILPYDDRERAVWGEGGGQGIEHGGQLPLSPRWRRPMSLQIVLTYYAGPLKTEMSAVLWSLTFIILASNNF